MGLGTGMRPGTGMVTGTGMRPETGMGPGPGMSARSRGAQPGTHRCRGDRRLAEEPLGLLELAVPPVVFAVGVPGRETDRQTDRPTASRGPGGAAGAGRAGAAGTHFWLVR